MQGVMGAGIAKTIKRMFPELYKEYHEICCVERKATLGGVHFYKVSSELYIANAFTQIRFGDARPEAIKSVLKTVSDAFPAPVELRAVRVGCGLGGLEWDDIKPIYEEDKGEWEVYFLDLHPTET